MALFQQVFISIQFIVLHCCSSIYRKSISYLNSVSASAGLYRHVPRRLRHIPSIPCYPWNFRRLSKGSRCFRLGSCLWGAVMKRLRGRGEGACALLWHRSVAVSPLVLRQGQCTARRWEQELWLEALMPLVASLAFVLSFPLHLET